jgi:DNA-directed RNA polymerase subunit RPC12/RpoP
MLSMPIKFNCHKCGAKLRVPEQHIGKKARCPKCDEKCVVPETSQRGADSALGGNFEDIGNFLDQPSAAPVGLPPAVGVPVASPMPPPPAMASPVGVPLPSSVPPPMAQSPYSSPMPKGSSANVISGSIMQPLYEARGLMKFFGWSMFIIGILYCCTIVLAIFGWLPLWMGWLVKGAAESITIGVETGDKGQLHLANQRLGTFFKILGVIAIIYAVIIALYLLFFIVMIVIGLIGMAANA